ncbi:hypothetical protein [Aquibacillus salsiterrae]|uniref:Uncharacterized protein n=1 Tax=Aquibacillus salsiterrae TaxID=2950439 RepID=A0A9X4AG67_9BACI|nr:hypothetical protein [Aquibacillus salsiterrae]MDC3418631.1 hypothetical protein [Aquibacillus salsiterrae]
MARRNNGWNDQDFGKMFGGFDLNPQQIAVVTAILVNALEVHSVLVDRDQTVQIVLNGSFRKKTERDELIEKVSGMSVGDLFDSLLNR